MHGFYAMSRLKTAVSVFSICMSLVWGELLQLWLYYDPTFILAYNVQEVL